MPHGGIPPEVADDILELVRDDTATLVACCRASRGLCARARPLLYNKLEIVYQAPDVYQTHLLSRSSANLVDTLHVNPELGHWCRELRIRCRRKEPTDLVRQHTEPVLETIRELFERLPNLVSFAFGALEDEDWDEEGGWVSTPERSIAEVLQEWRGWTTLRRLRLPRLGDNLLAFILGLPQLAVLQVASATSRHPIPSDLLPPFSLQDLRVTNKLDDNLFRCGTANSQQSLVRLTVPFSFDLKNHLAPFANLRHLCLDFSSYNLGGFTHNRERLQELKEFLSAETRLTSLRFSSTEAPRSGRIHVLHSALPRNLQTLVLHPWPLVFQDAVRCLEVGTSKQLWSTSLARIVWTSASSY